MTIDHQVPSSTLWASRPTSWSILPLEASSWHTGIRLYQAQHPAAQHIHHDSTASHLGSSAAAPDVATKCTLPLKLQAARWMWVAVPVEGLSQWVAGSCQMHPNAKSCSMAKLPVPSYWATFPSKADAKHTKCLADWCPGKHCKSTSCEAEDCRVFKWSVLVNGSNTWSHDKPIVQWWLPNPWRTVFLV